MAEARVVKFCKQVGYIKSQPADGKSFLKGAWLESRDKIPVCDRHADAQADRHMTTASIHTSILLRG